jgi:hypothetical protein
MKTTIAILTAAAVLAACASGPTAARHAQRMGDSLDVDASAHEGGAAAPWLPTQPSPLPACASGQDTCANPDRSAGGCCAAGTLCGGAAGTCPGACCP